MAYNLNPQTMMDMVYRGSTAPVAPTPLGASQSNWDQSAFAANPLASGIAEAAAELGMDPVDLATIISYETAGTFDPTKAGPTTQWGQHRGLIQWGEPQAREYGVNWDDPIGSQLGANGAIVRYFRDRGWRPGMGLLDAYSIVNAGAPGRYNASDANNGGAPGTVADKVNNQMGEHRDKAVALFGGQAPGSGAGGVVPPRPGMSGGNPYIAQKPMVPGSPGNALQGFQTSQLDPKMFMRQRNALAPTPLGGGMPRNALGRL